MKIFLRACICILVVSSATDAQTTVRSRAELEAAAAAKFPRPVEPQAPVMPARPGVVGTVASALVLGGAGFAGSSTLCSKTETAPSPLGAFIGTKYYTPGSSVTTKSTPCAAGVGAGSALLGTVITHFARRGGYQRRLAAYNISAAEYPAQKAQYDRALAQWKPQLDAEVSRLEQDDRNRVAQDAAEREVANREASAKQVPASATQVAMAPLARPQFVNDLQPVRTPLRNPNAVAVVIGNRSYRRSEIPAVEYAERDAELVKRYLVESFGFQEENIILESNAGLSTMMRIFGSRESYRGQLFNFLTPNRSSDVFVFYSGHGAPDPETGSTFLVTSDADPQTLALTAYPLRQLYENLSMLPARSLTVVLDACFSGLTDRGSLLRGISPLTLRVENPVLAAPNAVVLAASASNEVSGWYDQVGHGLFTYVLLDQLGKSVAGSREAPSAKQLLGAVGPEVMRLSRRLRQRDQTPQVFGLAQDQPLPFARR